MGKIRGDAEDSDAGAGSSGLRLKLMMGGGGGSGAPSNPLGGVSSGKVEKHKKKKKKKDHKKKHDRKDKEHKKHKKHKRRQEEYNSAANPSSGGIVSGSALGVVGEDDDDAMGGISPEDSKDGFDGVPSVASSTGDHSGMTTPQQTSVKVKRVVSTTNNFARFLEYLLKLLQKKDTNDFFANPVNDQFAPGYSSIIKQPMDFSTIRSKLKPEGATNTVISSYPNLQSFKSDFELMCTNAMTYNTQDTIYYKSATKLLSYGRKILSPEKIRGLRNHLPFIKTITQQEFGFDVNADPEDGDEEDDQAGGAGAGDSGGDDTDVAKVIQDIREVVRRPPGRFEAIPDDMTAQEILEHARDKAKRAQDKLKAKRPGSKMGFLRQRPDGTTSLTILTGEPGIVPGTEKDRPVSLGTLLGKVKQGTSSISGFREDRRNTCKGVYPLHYGAYSSHCPTYDSTFANLTKEETELVYNTYSDHVGVQYAESIMNFSRDCDYATFIVDHLLDILTNKEHQKTSKYIEEKKKLRREDALLENTAQTIQQQENEAQRATGVDFDSLKSLSAEGIDMSFLDSMQATYNNQVKQEIKTEDAPPSDDLVALCNKNAELLEKLQRVQDIRLSANPPPHFASMAKPSDEEMDLAQKVRDNLVEMSAKVQPRFVASSAGIRKAIGASDLPS